MSQLPPIQNAPVMPENSQASLPAMSERPFKRLPIKALWQMRLTSLAPVLIFCALLAGILFGLLPIIFIDTGMGMPLSVGQRLLIIAGVFIGFALLYFWLTRLRYNYTGYRLDADGLAIRQGVLWRTETIALRARVQHIDIARTPLSRMLGLAKINVYTAGTKLGKISLEGLALADAESIRDQLISRSADTL